MHQGTSAEFRPDSASIPVQGEQRSVSLSWLSLGEAAAAIGVHTMTLRRWADRGLIPFSRTAGRHRRFRQRDVEALLRGRRRIRRLGGLEGRWAAQAQSSIRRDSPFDASDLIPLGSRDRLRFRRSGQKLMALMVGVSAGSVDSPSAQRRARRLGRSYASWAAHRGVASTDMLRAFNLVRQTLIDAAIDLAQSENLEPQAVRGLLAVLEDLAEAVEIGLLEAVLPGGHPATWVG